MQLLEIGQTSKSRTGGLTVAPALLARDSVLAIHAAVLTGVSIAFVEQ